MNLYSSNLASTYGDIICPNLDITSVRLYTSEACKKCN